MVISDFIPNYAPILDFFAKKWGNMFRNRVMKMEGPERRQGNASLQVGNNVINLSALSSDLTARPLNLISQPSELER